MIAELLQNDDAPADRWADAAALLLVDAVLDADVPALESFVDGASRRASRLAGTPAAAVVEAFAAVASRGAARTRPVATARTYNQDSVAGRILVYLHTHPASTGKTIGEALGIPAETISRIGSQLESERFVVRYRVGKSRSWELTPSGRAAGRELFEARRGTADPADPTPLIAWEAQELTPKAAIDIIADHQPQSQHPASESQPDDWPAPVAATPSPAAPTLTEEPHPVASHTGAQR